MTRDFNGSWGGRNDYARYTLTSYNENRACGVFTKSVNNKCDMFWPGTNTGRPSTIGRAGFNNGDTTWYWAGVTFNYDELAELRAKDVRNVRFEIYATINQYVDIDMKRNSAANNMARCDKDGTATNSTKLGKFHSSSPNYVSSSGNIRTFDLTNDINGNFVGVPRYGYVLGRNTSSTSTSFNVYLLNQETLTTTSKRAHLYVITNERQSFLSFDLQGGSGTCAQREAVGPDGIGQVVIPSYTGTKSGYTFDGWATAAGRTEGTYHAGDTYTVNGDTTLYAAWKPEERAVAILPGAEGTGEGVTDAYPYLTEVTLPESGAAARVYRDGYSVTGWSTTDGGEKDYDLGETVTVSNDLTLYPVWQSATYTVDYDANGGSGAPASQTKYGTTPLTLSATVPTWAEHSFLGWATSPTGAVEYMPGGTYTDSADATLYAIWEPYGGFVRIATHDGVKQGKAYIFNGGTLKRARVYIQTEDGLKEGR